MKRIICCLSLTFLLMVTGLLTTARAQGPYRLTHEEVKDLIVRIEKNTDVLRATIEGHRPAEFIDQSVINFERAADRLKARFDDENSAVAEAEEVLRRGQNLSGLMRYYGLSEPVRRDWMNLYRDLNSLARAYHAGFNWSSPAMTPYRVSHESVKNLLKSIERRADSFRASLDEALDGARFDSTRREEGIDRFITNFEIATDKLRERFDVNYTANNAVGEVLWRGIFIDHFMRSHLLTWRAQYDWQLLKDNLDELARAYNVPADWRNGAVLTARK